MKSVEELLDIFCSNFEFGKPSDAVLSELKRRVVFSQQALLDLDIRTEHLGSFIFREKDFSQIESAELGNIPTP